MKKEEIRSSGTEELRRRSEEIMAGYNYSGDVNQLEAWDDELYLIDKTLKERGDNDDNTRRH